ncbi:hypothetical protein C8R43DRAFT_972278 [Mycena crocata]|nr:hypothetical protein C8R43DRAFT_972278 [Mycena crocata]
MAVKCSSLSSSRPAEIPATNSNSTAARDENSTTTNFTHLIDKLDALATFYQQQLDWVDAARVEVNVVEPESDDQLSETETQPVRPAMKRLPSAELRRMHWRRQMRSLESKLNGNAHKHRAKSACRRAVDGASGRRKACEEEGTHYILSIFGQMMGARMESCRRVQKLVAFTSKTNEKLDGGRYGPTSVQIAIWTDSTSRRNFLPVDSGTAVMSDG